MAFLMDRGRIVTVVGGVKDGRNGGFPNIKST